MRFFFKFFPIPILIFNLTCLIVNYIHIVQNSKSKKAQRMKSLYPSHRVPGRDPGESGSCVSF